MGTRTRSRVVHEHIQASPRAGFDLFHGHLDGIQRGNVQLDGGDAQLLQMLHLAQVAGRGEDLEAPLEELLGEVVANPALASAGDENGWGHE